MKKQLLQYCTLLFVLFICPATIFTACSKDDDNTEQGNNNQSNQNNNQQSETHALVGTWQGEVQDKGGVQSVTYCFNADGTGWDNWNGEKEVFTWYTRGDILNIVYRDDSPYGDGYDEESFRYAIANNRVYIYELDETGNNKELLGIFTKQGSAGQQPETHALTGTWQGEVQDKGVTYSVTYCFNADGTGWDNWNGEKEVFTWYTKGDMLTLVYRDDSPDGDGYDEENLRYAIANNRVYIYELDDSGNNRELIGVFTKQ